MPRADLQQMLAGLRITSLGILTSRVLGMLREVAMAALLGMSGGGVMDAFVVAFRLPNLFRRLFGEGALAISYLPVFSATLEQDRASAWRLASVMLAWLSAVLTLLVVLCEAICWGLLWQSDGDASRGLVLGLSAVMLPYLAFICLAAQVSATLHALGEFTAPALAPAFLNVAWLAAVLWIAPWWTSDKATQAYIIAATITVGGAVQLAVQLPALRRLGMRWDYDVPAIRDRLWEVVRGMTPIMLGLTATQFNTFINTMVAWGLTSDGPAPQAIGWLGGQVNYPLQPGAAAAIYYGERLYQLPQGMIGVAVATVIFPLLSRHAARGHVARLGRDLTLAMRLVIYAAMPACVGLYLLAEPITRLLFEHGEFTADDSRRTAQMIALFGTGVWAFCAQPVIARGYYAVGDRMTPLRIGLWGLALNFLLNVTLVWPLAEAGLAVSNVASAAFQTVALMLLFSRRAHSLQWRALARTTWQTAVASAAMFAAGMLALHHLPSPDDVWRQSAQVLVPLAACGLVFAATSLALRQDELWMLLGRGVLQAELESTEE